MKIYSNGMGLYFVNEKDGHSVYLDEDGTAIYTKEPGSMIPIDADPVIERENSSFFDLCKILEKGEA